MFNYSCFQCINVNDWEVLLLCVCLREANLKCPVTELGVSLGWQHWRTTYWHEGNLPLSASMVVKIHHLYKIRLRKIFFRDVASLFASVFSLFCSAVKEQSCWLLTRTLLITAEVGGHLWRSSDPDVTPSAKRWIKSQLEHLQTFKVTRRNLGPHLLCTLRTVSSPHVKPLFSYIPLRVLQGTGTKIRSNPDRIYKRNGVL